MTHPTFFDVEWEGRKYRLSLRTAPDGFVPAWQEAAAQLAIFPFAVKAYALPDEFFHDEARCTRFFSLIIAEALDGGWKRRGPDGREELEPIPWRSWLDLDVEDLKRIAAGFFFSLSEKLKRSSSSKSFMGVELARSTSLLSEVLTRSTVTPSSQPDPFSTPTGHSENAADTASADLSSSEISQERNSETTTDVEALTLAVPTRLVEMTAGDGKRAFYIRRVLAERSANLLRRIGPDLTAILQTDASEEEKRRRMIEAFFQSASAADETMRAILVGNHDGIVWARDGDPAEMIGILLDFCDGISRNARALEETEG